jgi:hypothetical protein
MTAASVSVSEPTLRDLFFLPKALTGELGLEGPGVGWAEVMCLDLCFFLLEEASVPEASDRLGEPVRFSDLDEVELGGPLTSRFSRRPDGVFVPEDGRFDLRASSSSFVLRSCSSRSRSSSLSV